MFIVERVSIAASNHVKTKQLQTAVNLPWCCGSGTQAELSRAALQLRARSAGPSQLHSAGGWAERGWKASLTCLAPQLECLKWLMALLTPSSCGSSAGVQMVYKGSSAPRVSLSKGPSRSTYHGQPYHLLMSHWSKHITKSKVNARRDHPGVWTPGGMIGSQQQNGLSRTFAFSQACFQLCVRL